MPRSTSYFPDINVWLALVSRRHAHNPQAVSWLEGRGACSLSFCRITQMGLLRLLTNHRVMGPDALTQTRAWDAYGRLAEDARIRYLEEPRGLGELWRSLTQRESPAPHTWTDAYLLAFARAAKLSLVTFDQGFKAVDDSSIVVLGDS